MAAKSILFLLTLALVAASAGRAFAAAWIDDDDLPQRQEVMEEAVHVIYNYDPEHDAAEMVQRAMGVVSGKLAPLRPIFEAMSKMPECSAKDEARAVIQQLL